MRALSMNCNQQYSTITKNHWHQLLTVTSNSSHFETLAFIFETQKRLSINLLVFKGLGMVGEEDGLCMFHFIRMLAHQKLRRQSYY